MKKAAQSRAVRITAFLLCILCGLSAVLCAAGYLTVKIDRDDDLPAPECAALYRRVLRNVCNNVIISADNESLDDLPSGYSCIAKDMRTEKVIFDSHSENAVSLNMYISAYWDGWLDVELYYEPNETPDDSLQYLRSSVLTILHYENKYLPVGIVSLLLCLALFIFLMASAGRTADGPVLRGLDRMPFDVFLCVAAAAILIPAWIFFDGIGFMIFYYDPLGLWLTVTSLFIAWEGAVVLGVLCSAAARARAGGMWKKCVTYKVVLFLWHGLCSLCRSLPTAWKGIAVYAAIVAVNFFGILFTLLGDSVIFLLQTMAADIAGLCFVVRLMRQLQTLQTAARKLAEGDLTYTVDTEKMLPVLKEHGNDLNAVSVGISRAVNERMKSERFKTELITNVSHDLKTPLTSIVSYVDLLKKEPIESETARGYIEVLERQSHKLKKLTTDLVDASKASSGALPVNLEKLDLGELVRQSTGEYTEKFAAASVDPVLTLPETETIVCADGRLLWRTLDNLLGNAVKYAQAGTRLYIDLADSANETVLTLKNISREPLNIPAEELLERFVRGDSSRHTDGSGLGLSIASSLMELMGGRLTLQLDGDLFKAILTFPKKSES